MHRTIIKFILFLCLCSQFGYAQVISTFDNQETTLGWTTSFFPSSGPFTTPTSTGNAALSHGANGDNKLDIFYSGSSLLYFEAPSDFLGNKFSAFNKSLSFDVGDNGTGTEVNGPDVILVGGGLTLVLDISTNPPTNSTLTLGHFDVMLAPSSAWHISSLTGITPTTAQFQSALSALTALRIRGSFHQSGVAGIDNILMVPEPSVSVFILLSSIVFASRALSRTRRCS
jgi:hypothetical protein